VKTDKVILKMELQGVIPHLGNQRGYPEERERYGTGEIPEN
jgi:hypothetical protein